MQTSTAQREITLAVIGDSAAYGTGDFDPQGNPRGWAHYLAQSLRHESQNCRYLNFSRPGAKSGEVAQVQLPLALANNPDIAAVIAGGNDMLRNGFDPEKLKANLRVAIWKLRSANAVVIMVMLHDPCQLLRIPRLLKRVLRRRVNAVNQVYEELADELDLILIRTREIPDVHNLANWHIDRMHPGVFGHQLLARQMAHALTARGFSLIPPTITAQNAPDARSRFIWLIRNGAPWFLKRSVDLLPVAIILMAYELLRFIIESLQKTANRA